MMRISWPTALVLAIAIAGVAAAYLFGPMLGVPPDMHAEFVAGAGAFGALATSFMRQMLTRDDNHNGIADVLERPSNRDANVPPPLDDVRGRK